MAIPVTRKESLDYCIQQNYLVFPVRKNKKPAFFGYKEDGKKKSFAYEEDLFKDLEQIEESNYWNRHSNIGIACGFSNLIVIDCDVKKGKDGINDYLKILVDCGLEGLKTRTIKTPTGGRHFYFLNPKGYDIRSVNEKVADGIDIKTKGGYIIAPGSETDKGKYSVEIDMDPIEIPEKLAKHILKKQNGSGKSEKKPTDNKEFPETVENWQKIWHFVKNYKANCGYQEWGKIILIMRSLWLYNGWDETKCRNLAITWSKDQKKYPWNEECEKLFNGWWDDSKRDQDQALTYRTLFKMLIDKQQEALDEEIVVAEKSNGKIEFKHDLGDESYEDAMERAKKNGLCIYDGGQPHDMAQTTAKSIQENKAEIDIPNEDAVVVESSDDDTDYKKAIKIMRAEFYLYWRTDKMHIIPVDEWRKYRNFELEERPAISDPKVQKTALQRVLKIKYGIKGVKDGEASTIVENFKQTIRVPKRKIAFTFNELRPEVLSSAPTSWRVKYPSKEWKPLDQWKLGWTGEYLQEIITAGNEADYKDVLLDLSDIAQNPNKKSGRMTHLISAEGGTGKSTFFALLENLFGKGVVKRTSRLEDVTGNHSDVLLRSLLICFDEFNGKFDKKGSDQLKSLVTEDVISVRGIYQAPVSLQSGHRFYTTSNHETVKDVDIYERRDWFLRVSPAWREKKSNFTKMRKEWENISAGSPLNELMGLMMTMDLSNYDRTERNRNQEFDKQVIDSLKGVKKYLWDMADSRIILSPLNSGWTETIYEEDGGFLLPVADQTQVLSKHDEYGEGKYPSLNRVAKNKFLRELGIQPDASDGSTRCWKMPPLKVLRAKLLEHLKIKDWKWEN